MTVAIPQHVSGQVLDGSAIAAWAHGSLMMATWTELAARGGTMLLVPAAASGEAQRAVRDDPGAVGRFFEEPTVVVKDAPSTAAITAVHDRFVVDGVLDPVATWVTTLGQERDWPVLTADPDRLRRIDPEVAINRV